MSEDNTTRQMCDTCRQALAGLPDTQIVWRPTADLLKIGFPVLDPDAAYSSFQVGDYRAFFSASTPDATPQDIEQ